MLSLKDFEEFKINHSKKIEGGRKILVIAGLSDGRTRYIYDDCSSETCNDDNNDDFTSYG